MMAPAHNMSKRSRWMDWQPKPRIMAPLAPDKPSKPSKPRFEGFVGSPKAEISIIRGQLPEQVVSLDDTTGAAISAMPPGVRLIDWKPKEPPVAIETCAVVTDSGLFARTTFEQLGVALANPRRWVGWSVPQLLDRLAQVGVMVTLGECLKFRDGGRR
jgi:hypothetical protein